MAQRRSLEDSDNLPDPDVLALEIVAAVEKGTFKSNLFIAWRVRRAQGIDGVQ